MKIKIEAVAIDGLYAEKKDHKLVQSLAQKWDRTTQSSTLGVLVNQVMSIRFSFLSSKRFS